VDIGGNKKMDKDNRKYLDEILQTIQNKEPLNESYGSLGGVAALITFLSLQAQYKSIRQIVDKNYAKCKNYQGPSYKKCMLQSKIVGMLKAIEVASKVGPAKCKMKKDPKKCIEKVKSSVIKTKQQIKVLQAKISVL